MIPEFLIICPAGRIRSARSVSEHARPSETRPRGAQCWAIRGKSGLLIISNSSLASVQTKCHLVPTGGVWARSLTRWQSKKQNGNRKRFTSKVTCGRGHSVQQYTCNRSITTYMDFNHFLTTYYFAENT